MSKTINIGIDLGTTNSAICYFDKGEVKIFKDPVSWKDTIPSVVSFRKDRIIVGQKAKEFIEKSPQNTVGLFKRKMGTNENFKIKSLGKSITPIELSAHVLKELKSFVQDTSIDMSSTVITIPASFDTIQSNATKQTGELAGFKEVVLLQEPIAASLAYANSTKENLEETKWLVYDFGGGTFDVALLSVSDGEMKVLDHEGDNFLGGSDFDRLIVEKIVVPYLEENYNFKNLVSELQNSNGKYNKLYYKLLYLAEQVKIQLSAKTSADIEFEIEDEMGEEIDVFFTITKDEFEKTIKSQVVSTTEMIKKILTNNSLRANEINFVLMIGGSTYIPYIRKYVEEALGIKVNTNIDPTTAVAIGATYYAGNKKKTTSENQEKNIITPFKIKMAYEKSTQEDSEYLAIKVDGDTNGFTYKINREDGGFSSSSQALTNRISEDLPLVKDAYNFFTLSVYDNHGNIIQSENIEISQGKYTISGQPLPEDICFEVDDSDSKTKLELIFKKNATLPLKKTITKDINKTIKMNSNDEIVINVLEGDGNAIPEANKSIGKIKISGKDIERDILKGSDIEITLEISESRDISVSAYLSMTDQEFQETFNPQNRDVDVYQLSDDVEVLSEDLDKSLEFAKEDNDYQKIDELYEIQSEMTKLEKELDSLDEDDTTDKRYQLEDKKRAVAKDYYASIKDERLNKLQKEYLDLKSEVEKLVAQYGDYAEQEYFKEIIENESVYLKSNNISKIEELLEELHTIQYQMLWKQPDFVRGMFAHLIQDKPQYKDSSRANILLGKGLKYLERDNIEELADITRELFSLLAREEQNKVQNKIGFY